MGKIAAEEWLCRLSRLHFHVLKTIIGNGLKEDLI